MRKAKSYSVLEVLNFSDVGLTFEFYTTKETDFIVSDLSRISSKNVVLTNETKYRPSYSDAILLKEYEATKSRYKLSLAPQNFHSAVPIVEAVSQWINEYCETANDTQMKISLSFNHGQLETLSSISQMNPVRLMLKFDESFVYQRFPDQQNSPYAISIKKMAPINTYISENAIERNINMILTTPQAEYYGIDFSRYTQGVLECNYIGGKGYASNPQNIKDIIEYFIVKTYQSINEENYSDFEKHEITKLADKFSKIQPAYFNPDIFMKEYQDLKVYVNLMTSSQILKSYWSQIRDPLFEMILNGGLRKGQFNYDTDIGKFQLRKGKVTNTILKNMDFVSCELSGVLENSTFVSCELSKSRIYNSKFISGNTINESYLGGASVNSNNEIYKCFVLNNDEIINCPVKESVIKFATPGTKLKVDEQTTVVVKEMPLPQKSHAVQVDEIRDYVWIKGMRKSEDAGFVNLYNKNKYLK